MEHLLNEEELELYKHKLPIFPWHGFDHDTNQYNVVRFTGYPLQRGWTEDQLNALWEGTSLDRHPSECLVMIQSWFIFGFLEAATRERFSLSNYVRNTADGPVLDTTPLRDYIKRSHFEAAFYPDVQKREDALLRTICQWTNECLRDLEKWYLKFYANVSREGALPALFRTADFDAVLRSAVLIGNTIQRANCHLADMLHVRDRAGTSLYSSMPREQLWQKGWCPSLNHLFHLNAPALLEYANLIEPTDREHQRHKSCVMDAKCQGINIDVSTYRSKHVTADCNCQYVCPPLREVLSTLQMGSFPLVELSEWVASRNDIGCVSTPLPIKQWEKGSAYVAFSHVWIDGLGSDTERGLPSCQISALQAYAAKVAGTSLIWIDALCIPHDPSCRKKAIQMMSDVYKQSSAAIVLDAGLRSYSLSLESSPREVGIRLLTCVWIHRLWTLPECLLPPDVYIVFEREICSLAELLLKVLEQRQFPIEYTISKALSTLMRFKGDKEIPLGAIQNLLSGRDTSKLGDETLAIGPLLDLPISKLLDLTGEERVAQFWSTVGVVDRAIVFLRGPRLAKGGFGWAPKSMMSLHGSLPMDELPGGQGWDSAIVTEKGLWGTFFTYLLRKGVGRSNTTESFALALHDNKVIFVHVEGAEEPIDFSWDAIIVLTEIAETPDWIDGVALTAVSLEDDVQVFRYGRKVSMTFMVPNVRDVWKARTFPASSGMMEMIIS